MCDQTSTTCSVQSLTQVWPSRPISFNLLPAAAAPSAAQSIQQSIPESAALSDNVTLLNSTKQATFLKIDLILYVKREYEKEH